MAGSGIPISIDASVPGKLDVWATNSDGTWTAGDAAPGLWALTRAGGAGAPSISSVSFDGLYTRATLTLSGPLPAGHYVVFTPSFVEGAAGSGQFDIAAMPVAAGPPATGEIDVSWHEWKAGAYDLARFPAGDLDAPTLVDAVMESLLTRRRAREGDPLPDGAPRGGWWSDPTYGSRLWLIERAKATPETLRRAQDYAVEGLEWLVAEGIASKIAVTAERHGARLALGVTISRPTRPDLLIRFADLWEAL